MTVLEIIQTYLTEEEQTQWYHNVLNDHHTNTRNIEHILSIDIVDDYELVIANYFCWDRTPEGFDYWFEVCDKVVSGIIPEKKVFIITKHKFV